MIKNSTLYYGMPWTGKSTILMRTYIQDALKYHVKDLAISLWTYLHYRPGSVKATPNRISCPSGNFPALSIPLSSESGWKKALKHFHKKHPRIRNAMIDECQCLGYKYLIDLVSEIREIYPHVHIIFACIDYDSWHHRWKNTQKLIKAVPDSCHLIRRCMLCDRIADRRLHVVDHKPCYNEKQYNHILDNKDYASDGRPAMYTVCGYHYRHLPNDFEKRLKKASSGSHSRKEQVRRICKNLGLKPSQITTKKITFRRK